MAVNRPPKEILESFYGLLDSSPEKRTETTEKLLNNKDIIVHKDYIIDRIIRGLGSGRTAARLGFSTFLFLFLEKYPDMFTSQEILKLIPTKLPIKPNDKSLMGYAIGRHLAYVALYLSGVYVDSIEEIKDHHRKLGDLAPGLKAAIESTLPR